MAVILGGITLNPNMVWAEKYAYSPIVQDVQVTLAGTPIVYSQALQAGIPITLTALDDQGWLEKTVVDAVQSSAQVAGNVLTLTIGTDNFQVMFRHNDPPAVNLRPLIPRAVPLAGDYFVGEIRLLTVA